MKKIRIIALAALAVFFGACAFADAPEVVRAFSINGRFHCWVTGFADNPGSYAVQYRPYGSGDAYQNLGTTTGNWYGNGLPFNAEHCIVSEYPVLNGKYEFRISTADDMENWTDFIVDARHPLPGFEYYSGTGASSQTTFDSQINTYTLFNEAEAVNWFAVDLGEPKMLTSVAAVMNGGPGAIIEGSMDHDFSSVVTLKTLSAAEVDPTVFYSAGLGEPAVVRYVRIKNLGSGWFSVWELELDEGFFVSNDGTADKYPVFTIDSSISAEYGAAFFRSTDENSGFVEIGRVAAGATSWTDTSIGEDTTCYYRVAPIDSNGDALAPADYTLSYFRTLAPKVTKALAFNGKMNVWIEDFDQWNADLYDFQYRLSPSDAWVDYSKFTTGSNNTTGHPFGPSRMTLENNWKGVVEWRVAFKTLPGHWFNFTVDFGNPLGGTSIADYGEASGNSNSAQQTADGLLDTYYLAATYGSRDIMWAGLDFGEAKTFSRVSWLPNGSLGTIEAADSRDFSENFRVIYTLSGTDGVSTERHEVELPNPVTARYVRFRCDPENAGSQWYSVWEVQYDASFGVEYRDFANGYPTIIIDSRLVETNGAAVYRASSANGSYSRVGTAMRGVARWTDESSVAGQTFWYKVAPIDENNVVGSMWPESVSAARITRLERDSEDETKLRAGVSTIFSNGGGESAEDIASIDSVFDGNTATYPYFESCNPSIGLDFGTKPVHVQKLRLCCHDEPWYTYIWMRNLQVYGSNDEEDPFGNAEAISEMLPNDVTADGGFYREWKTIDCVSTNSYRYVFVKQGSDAFAGDPWRGCAAEIRLYGWRDVKAGLTVIVR